ncbi:MAG: family 20 glycosylhydrolase [Planctomycetes bacterium]|nr:family 20 glycosylhydrolase [Planctomycetota bacterium]
MSKKSRYVVGVHLDLKGTMFKPSYIPQLLGDLAGQGVNAVLVEYEDIFPFKGIDIAYDRKTVWSRTTLRKFLDLAEMNGIEVIPLQQCMGHLEYVLGWKKYRKFAEDKAYPSTINVTDRNAVSLIKEMLRQIVEGHPGSRFIHLGMDEAHAIRHTAKRLGRTVQEVFLEHLRVLLPVVESAGKKAYIWTDMLEDDFHPGAFKEFAGRVIFGTWDYNTAAGDELPVARLKGVRYSREWLDEPENPAAPSIGAGTQFVEDYPAHIKKVLEPYRNGRLYRRNFHIDLWTKEGMTCLPVSALRVSSNLSVLPPYNACMRNIRGWSKAIHRTKQLGQIGTSWARGTSWCPPNFSIDLQWPQIAELSRSMGNSPRPFWPGIPPKTVERIIKTLGRSREDWRLEGKIAAEMEALSPKVKEHSFEWDGTAMMARVLELQRRASYNIEEVDFFHANIRPVESEWQRRIAEQKQTLRDIEAMRKKVIAHFGKRYHGDAFNEWVRHLFDLYVKRIEDCQAICRKKLALAKKVYASKK